MEATARIFLLLLCQKWHRMPFRSVVAKKMQLFCFVATLITRFLRVS